jgi:hypothetical protein
MGGRERVRDIFVRNFTLWANFNQKSDGKGFRSEATPWGSYEVKVNMVKIVNRRIAPRWKACRQGIHLC